MSLFRFDKVGSGCLRQGHSVGNLGPIVACHAGNPHCFSRKPFNRIDLGSQKAFLIGARFSKGPIQMCNLFNQIAQTAVSL
jgi:hypothetical protein